MYYGKIVPARLSRYRVRGMVVAPPGKNQGKVSSWIQHPGRVGFLGKILLSWGKTEPGRVGSLMPEPTMAAFYVKSRHRHCL